MKRLGFIDGLRGLGASMVVLYHLGQRTSLDPVTHYGYLGVAIFFVLSGFVIAMTINDRTITWSFAGRFAARRSVRLDPVYWFSIALAIVLGLLATQLGHPHPMPSITDVITHVFYLQDLVGITPISSVFWTLCLEIQFYLFLLCLLWLRQFIQDYFPVVVLMTILISLLELTNLTDISPTGLFLPYWGAFALGATLYWTVSDQQNLYWLFGGMLITMPFCLGDHADWIAVSLLTTMLIAAAYLFDKMGQWLCDPVMQCLGKISYSLYLMHPLIGWTAQSFALQYVNPYIAFGIGISASLFSAWIVYYCIERPSVRLSRHVKITTHEG